MAALETFANNPSTTVMAGGTGDPPPQLTNETWTVSSSSSGFPSASTGVTQFHIGDPAVPSEVILVYDIVGTTWYVTRGVEGSPTVEHSAGFTVVQIVTAGWLGSVTAGSFVNPMSTLGDTMYGASGGTATRLAGGTVAAKRFLTQTGNGTISAAPVWGTIATGDVPVLNQSTTGNAATAGTAAAVSGTVTTAHGGTGLSSLATYAVVTGGTSATAPVQQVASAGTAGQVLTSNGAGTLPSWTTLSGGSIISFPITVLEGGTGGTTAALAITNLGAADLTSAQTLNTKTLKNTSLTFSQLGTVATSQSLNCANGNVQELTLGGSIAVSSMTGPGGTAACDLTLYIVQAASGGPYSITSWPVSVTWLGGGAPTIQSTAGAVTVVTFESLNGGTAWYGAQITGAPALPLGITLGGTGATDSNDALTALAGEGVLSIFGNGNDGAVTFDGTTAYSGFSSLSGSTYTLTRDVQGAGITVDSGVIVTTSSATGTFRIFCQGIVTINSGGTISANGNAAGVAPTAGAVLASGSLVGGRAGGTGGAAPSGQGGNGTNANMGVAGGTGGTAGSSGGVAGTAGTVTVPGSSIVTNVFNTPFPLLTGICMYGGFTLQIGFGAGGSGGGGATGDAGGGGGGGGGIVAIFAYNVINNGVITAAGGAGGAGAGGNAGGGGGGAGGLIITYTLAGWTQGTTNVAGGNGGTGPGSGANGANGGAGTVVSVVLTS